MSGSLTAKRPGTSERQPILDVLRIVAVGMVVLVHIFQWYGSPLGQPFGIPGVYTASLGGYGVSLLLVLSGYLLEARYGGRQVDLRGFMWRRVAHIYPTYWLSLLAAIVVFGRRPDARFGVIEHVMDGLGFLALDGAARQYTILPTSFFIGTIVTLYVLWPVMSAVLRRRPLLAAVGFLAVAVLARLFASRYLPPRAAFPLSSAFEFGFGMWMATVPAVSGSVSRLLKGLPIAVRSVLHHVAELSFPLYLLHYAVQRWAPITGLSPALYVPVFLALSTLAAEAVLFAAHPVERWLLAGGRSR